MLVASSKFECNWDRSLSSLARSSWFSDWYDDVGVSHGDFGEEWLLPLEREASGRLRNDLDSFSESFSFPWYASFFVEESFFLEDDAFSWVVELKLAPTVSSPRYLFVGLRRRINLVTAFPEDSFGFSGRLLDALRSAISQLLLGNVELTETGFLFSLGNGVSAKWNSLEGFWSTKANLSLNVTDYFRLDVKYE